MPRLDASNDFFIRTSDERARRRVQEVLQRVHDNGHVYKGIYEGWYCPRCADFKVENEIAEGNRCPIHEIPLVREQEENWFFRLSTFQEPLERLYAEQPDFVLPRERCNEALAFIESAACRTSRSARGKLTWGVQVPWDPTHVFYVWFDALLNYYTALGYARARRGPDRPLLAGDVPRHRQGHPEVPHGLLAGDAARRRPAAARARLRPRLPARRRRAQDEQVAGQRARPVRGHGPLRRRRAALLPAARRHVRAATARCRSSGVAARYESELANELGNLASRTIAMLHRYRDGARPGGRARTRPRGRVRRPVASDVARAHRPRRAHAGARRDLAARAAAEPLRRGAGAVAAGQGRRARRASSTACCARWPRACASLAVLLHPWLPADVRASCSTALGAPRPLARRRARCGAGAAAARSARSSRCSPSSSPAARVIDSHTHLDACEPPDDGAGRRGRARPGVTRILTVGHGRRDAAARRSRPPRRFDEVRAAIGRHPNHATGFGDADLAELARARARTRAARRSARPAWTSSATRAPRADQERAFHAQIELARATGQAARHPHPRGGGRDARDAARPRRRPRGRPALLLDARPPRRVPRAGWWISLRRQRDLPGARRPRRRRRARPRRPPARRDRRAVPHAAAGPQGAQPAGATSSHTARFVAERRGQCATRSSRRVVERNAREALRLVSATPAARPSPACAACASSACARSATSARTSSSTRTSSASSSAPRSSTPGDVVLEIGGGLGVLSEHLAPRARRTSTSWRSTARSCPRCATRSTPTRTRRCTSPTRWRSTSRALDPRADEGRRQPALRHRGGRDPAHDRGAARA